MLLIDYFERTAAVSPARTFLHFVAEDDSADVELSYEQANQWASLLARALLSRGVGKASVLALLMHNSPDWIVTYLACQKIGAICVGLHTGLTVPELVGMLETIEARYLAHGDEFEATAGQLRILKPDVMSFAMTSIARIDLMASDAARQPPLARLADLNERDALTATFTSGTTGGIPKAGLQTHGPVVRASARYIDYLKMDEHDRVMIVTPLSHSAALNWGVSLALMSGATLVLSRRFSASRFWAQARRGRPSTIWTMGTILFILLQQADSDHEQSALTGLRFIFGAGSAPRRAQLEQRWGCPVLDGYGMTETFGTLTSFDIEDNVYPYACMGRAIPGIDLRVVDPRDGHQCAAEETGEIVARFGQGFAGYLNNEAATRDAVRDGWFHTGDLAFQDPAGRFYFVDRLKSIIRRGGENISSLEIEECLASHPDIHEAIALPEPHPLLGETVLAVLIPRDAARQFTLEEIQNFCAGRLSRFKWPESVRTVSDDRIPRTGAGKVKKPILLRSLLNAS